jgi:mono/diheme cytochrome c family protein
VCIDRLSTRLTLVAFVLLAGFGRPTAAAQADDQALITKGEYLARAGDCIACHTKPEGALFAGGRPMLTPFGTIYTSNITPDPKTGIGSWNADQFYGTMRYPYLFQ